MTVAIKNPTAGVSLGKITKFASTLDLNSELERRNWRTGAVKNRYKLQSAAKKLLPNERVSDCMEVSIAGGDVHVMKDSETGHAHLKGLQRCGSVWVCPVCSAKIAIERRQELAEGFTNARAEGWDIAFVTYTARHTRETELTHMVAATKESMRGLKGGRWYRENIKSLGLEGTIQATEVTYGHANGWHVHYHVIMLFSGSVDLEELEQRLYLKWSQELEKNGLDCDREHGVMVSPGEQANNYISKWGLDSELTQGSEKKGRKESYTPFQLLGLYLDGHKWAAAKFIEFAYVFKGVNSIRWSKHLKDKLGVGAGVEVSDQEAAEMETSEHSTVIATMTWEQYKKLLKLGGYGVIGELLSIAELGRGALEIWLDDRFSIVLEFM